MTSINKIPIGGIKFSEELVHYTISLPREFLGPVNDMLQEIHMQQVNIPFLCHTTLHQEGKLSFCVSNKDAATIAEIVAFSSQAPFTVKTDHPVASVTVFPHKKQLSFAAVVLSLLESLSLPVYSSCSSISAFVFNTDFKDLSTIATTLTSIFELPHNHAPFDPQFQLRQPRNGPDSQEV